MRCGSTTSNYERNAAANSIMKYHYLWLMWASDSLVSWIILYLGSIQQHRVQMWWASVFMAPFGLSSAYTAPIDCVESFQWVSYTHLTKLPVLKLSGARQFRYHMPCGEAG